MFISLILKYCSLKSKEDFADYKAKKGAEIYN